MRMTSDWAQFTYKREYPRGPVPFYMKAILAMVLAYQIVNIIRDNYTNQIANLCSNEVTLTIAESMEDNRDQWTYDQFFFVNKKKGVQIASADVYDTNTLASSWACHMRMRQAADPIKAQSLNNLITATMDRLSD